MPKGKKNNVQYVIRRGLIDGVDYNNDGVIDKKDDIVVKYVNGVEVERKPLTKKVEKQMKAIVEKDKATTITSKQQVRVVYERVPRSKRRSNSNMYDDEEGPSPVVVKNESTFGHYIKAGAGMTLGSMAVNGIANALGGLFE